MPSDRDSSTPGPFAPPLERPVPGNCDSPRTSVPHVPAAGPGEEQADVDYRALFEQTPGLFLVVLPDAPRFTIVAASEAYLASTMTVREGERGIVGHPMFDVFPDSPDDPDATGTANLRASIERAVATRLPDAMPVQHYPIRGTNDRWQQRYWSPLNVPVLDAHTHAVRYVIHRVEDVTDAMRLSDANDRLAGRHADAQRSAQSVGDILESISDAFFALDRHWRFTYVNRQAETLLFRGRNDLVGRSIWQEFPEAVGTTFDEQYQRAARERVTVRFEEYFPPLDSWFEVRAYPAADGLTVYFQNINERHLGERVDRFSAAIGHAVTRGGTLPDIMHRCCQAAVEHLRAAFCRVWVLSDHGVLELVASAGLYTHLDGPHGRVPLGSFKIGQIAAERAPHLTNDVVHDARVSNQEWARREGMVSFAGYPLTIGGEVIGVVAMFSRHRLSDREFETLRTASDAISVAVANARAFTAEQGARQEAEQAVAELAAANATLQDQAMELEAQAEELAVTTEELAERTEAAESARTTAENANRSKGEFLATMSHELRTPLNAIGGYASLIEMGVQGPVTDAQRTALERIQRSQRHLLGLIDGILNFAKVDAGKVHYAVEDVPMRAMLTACESLITPQALERRLTVVVSACDAELTARADPEKVQQILLNLLTNAVKFTEPAGRVTMECSRADAGRVTTRITDTGPGIAPDQLERVFEPFVQLDATLTRTKEGTGLGLAISRDLARAMGGDLTVTSELGSGSTFIFTLPVA